MLAHTTACEACIGHMGSVEAADKQKMQPPTIRPQGVGMVDNLCDWEDGEDAETDCFWSRIDDLEAREIQQDPLFRCRIRRKIDGVVFSGHVEDINVDRISKDRLYLVRYTDGDTEYFTANQVEKYAKSSEIQYITLQVEGGVVLKVSCLSMAGNPVGGPFEFNMYGKASELCDRLQDHNNHEDDEPDIKLYNGSSEVSKDSELASFKTLIAKLTTWAC